MWRRNLLVRYPAPRESNTLARYAYSWDFKQDAQESVPIPSPVVSRKAQLNIIEQDGGVLIEFDKFTVFIKQK